MMATEASKMQKRKFFLSFLFVLVATTFFSSTFTILIPIVEASPTYEDFMTYTVVEPDNQITVASSTHIDFDIDGTADAYVYYDKTENHFSGNLEHLIDFLNLGAASNWATTYCWMLSNDLDDAKGLQDAAKSHLRVGAYRDNANHWIVVLREQDGVDDYSDTYTTTYSSGKDFYFTIERDETQGTYGNLTCKIYSDSARTNLLDTLYVELHSSKKNFRYIFPLVSHTTGNDRDFTGDVENLDLQENTSPTNDARASDDPFTVGSYGWVNITVTDVDGVEDLKFVDIQIDTTDDAETFILRWTQSSDTFSEASDPDNICTLDTETSTRVNIDSDTDKICFYFKFTSGASIGLCDITASSTDDSDFQDNDTWDDDFTLSDTTCPLYQNVGPANGTSIGEGSSLELYGQGKDETALDWAVLATNETGTWKNYTDVTTTTRFSEINKTNILRYPNGSIHMEGNFYCAVTHHDWGTLSAYAKAYRSTSLLSTTWTDSGTILSQDTSETWEKGTWWAVADWLYIESSSTPYWLIISTSNQSDTEEVPIIARCATWNGSYFRDGNNPIFRKTDESWCPSGVQDADIQQLSNGAWIMCFEGEGSGAVAAIGLSKCMATFPNGTWTFINRTHTSPASAVDWEKNPFIMRHGDDFYIAYEDEVGTTQRTSIMYASESNVWLEDSGWTRWTLNPLSDTPQCKSNDLVYEGETVYAVVHRVDGSGKDIIYGTIGDELGNIFFPMGIHYDSPMWMEETTSWKWSNFTWQNTSITQGTTVAWRIYYNDTSSNINKTNIHTFSIGAQAFVFTKIASFSLYDTRRAPKEMVHICTETSQFTVTRTIGKEKVTTISETIQASATSAFNIGKFYKFFNDLSIPEQNVINKEKAFTKTETITPMESLSYSKELLFRERQQLAISSITEISKETVITIVEFVKTGKIGITDYVSRQIEKIIRFTEGIHSMSQGTIKKEKHFTNVESIDPLESVTYNKELEFTQTETCTLLPISKLTKEVQITLIEIFETVQINADAQFKRFAYSISLWYHNPIMAGIVAFISFIIVLLLWSVFEHGRSYVNF